MNSARGALRPQALLMSCVILGLLAVAGRCVWVQAHRPMFHNWNRVLFWELNLPMKDELGRWLHHDAEDNILVLQDVGFPPEGEELHRFPGERFRTRPGFTEARFRVGSAQNPSFVLVPRQPNTLTVILGDGATKTFALRPDSWERVLGADTAPGRKFDLFRAVRLTLAPGDEQAFDAFSQRLKPDVE